MRARPIVFCGAAMLAVAIGGASLLVAGAAAAPEVPGRTVVTGSTGPGSTGPGSTGPGSAGPATTAPSTVSTTIAAGGEDTGLGPDITVQFESPPLILQPKVESAPLVVSPIGCPIPPDSTAVFIGKLHIFDFRTAQFTVGQVLAGSLDPWEVGGEVQISYGDDVRFLHTDTTYVVGAVKDPSTGLLSSKVREPDQLFGGDAVVGANSDSSSSDLQCPQVEDPVMTLTASGGPVDTGLLTPLRSSKGALLAAVLRPLMVAFGVLVVLVLIKQLAFATGRSLRSATVVETPVIRPPRRTTTRRRQRRADSVDEQQPGP
ncbi:MAG: hypothetical protein ABIQ39_08795 [Ilumatobacteraceae bacterium]